jgi:HEAT repeat protein
MSKMLELARSWLRAAAESEPLWTDPDATIGRYELLLELMEGLGSRRWGTRAAERMRDEAASWAPAEWARVDESLRPRLMYYSRVRLPEWIRGPEDVRRIALPAGTEAAVMGVLSMHPSGYVREAAVQRLALLGGGAELPPLLLRANDWVPQLRDRAAAALLARVVAEYVDAWMWALPLVLRLRGKGRADRRPLVDAIMALLRAPASRNAVWKGLYSTDSAVRRACFRIMHDHGRAGLHALVRDVMGSADPMLRLMAAQAAAELDDRALDEVLPAMLHDRFGRVRMAALRLGAERMGAAVLPQLRHALLDRSPGIRGDARTALAKLDPMDFAAFYRDRVGVEDAQLPSAVAGLAETGDRDDAARVAPLVDHPRVRVRTAALRALERLAGDDAVPMLMRALGDGSSAVSSTAREALRPRLARVDATVLGAWFAAAHLLHVRRNALSLLVLRDKWDVLPWILGALSDDEMEIRQAADAHLKRWKGRFNRSFTQPAPAQRERIRHAIDAVELLLSRDDLRWLRFASGTG